MHAINRGYYQYFTNGNSNYRELLKANVSQKEIKDLMLKTMSTMTNKNYNNTSELVSDYCEFFFRDELISKLDDMSQVTLENYDQQALTTALNKYIYYYQINGFSRYRKDTRDKTNYRNYTRYFDQRSMLSTIRRSLQMKGIDTSLIQDEQLTSYYSTILSNSDYEKALESSEYGSFSR